MERIKKIIEKAKRKVREFYDKIKSIKSDYDFYKGLWDRPEGKAAVALTLEQLIYLLKKLKPKKIEGDIVFGTGDPASTGQVLGAIAAVYGLIPEKLHIVPDFEEKHAEGTIYAKGKLRCIHLLIAIIKLVADKNVRYVMKKYQAREGKKNE